MRYLSTDQFESAHRHFKSQLVNSSNHKEIIHTMFKGATYKYSYMYSEDYIADSCVKFKSELKRPSSTLKDFVQSEFPDGISLYSKLKYYGFFIKQVCIFFKRVLGVSTFLKK